MSVETANQVVATGISEENAKRFTSDNDKYKLQYDSTSQTLTLVGHDKHPICGDVNCKEHTTISWNPVSDLTKITGAGYYYLTQDVEIKNPWSPANGVTLCLNGHSITLVGYDKSSVIKVESGTFTLCDCSGDSGKITNGYKAGGSQKYPGRGVSVSKNGTFILYGGSITGNTEGGVFVGSNRTFTMNGGSITGNTVTGSGGGVYVASGAEFTMNGGEITGNTSSSYGGGVYVYNGAEFTMTGGSITDNVAGASNENKSYGGGVYSTGTFTMTGGSITGNKAKYGGGGVWTNASFTVSGNVNITGNVGIDSKTASNVFRSLGTITIGKEGLKPEAKIGVTYSNKIDTGKYVTIATGAKDSCTADNFTADAGEPYGIKVESTGAYVDVNLYNGLPHVHYRCNGKDENGAETCTGIGHTEEEVLGFKPWTDANALPTASGEYYLTTDVTLDSAWDLRGVGLNEVRFVLCLNGHSIKLKDSASGNVINIGKNATLALCDCNGSNAGNGKITGSKASGVNIANNGAFVMYGGSISGNGTGVDVSKGSSKFNMYGGAITGNNCGVNVNSNDFIVAGKVNITGNKTSDGKTSNVYLPANKTITVSGALGTGAQIGVTTANTPAEGSYLTIAKGIDTDSSKYTLTETDLNAFTSDSSYDKRLNGNSIIFTKGDLHIHALCGASCTHTGTHSEVVWQPLTYNAETQTLYYGGTATSKAKDGSYKLPAGNYYLTDNITVDNGITITGNVNLCLNGKTLSTTVNDKKVDVIGVNSQNGKCTLTLCDCDTAGHGTITSQHKTNSGVQIYGYRDGGTTTYGNLVMYGGTVKGFRNGVFVGDGTFNMFGGTITGNECGVSTSSNASFTIGGTVNITGNTKNVDLGENVTITIDKSLTQDARIGITIATAPTADKPVQFATGATGELDYTGIFTPDAKDKSYVVRKGGDGSLFLGLHQHSWSYTANGATITAKCTAAGCPLENRIGGSVTISASNAVYDRSSKAATVTANDWKGDAVDSIKVTYTGRNETTYNSAVAPTNVGDYTASITLGEGENAKTASVEYSITAKEVTVTGITATDRYYAKDNLEVTLTGGTLTGVISGDTVTIDLTKAKGMMINANVGTNKAVTVTGVALGGADKGNYKLKEQPTGVTVNIIRADASVSITGAPTEKTYGDADFTVTAANGVTESTGNTGKWTWTSSDDTVLKIVSGGNSATATVQVLKASAAGVTLTATYSSITHYGTAKVTIKVNPKDVTITGLSAGNKDYDRSTSATPTGTAVIDGKVGSDDVTVTAGTASFDNENVGTDKTVTFTGYSLSGADAGNYNLKAQPASVTANITAKEVTITSLTAANRSYEKDNLEVALISGTLTGVFSGDTVTIDLTNAKGTMTDANAGTGKAVTVTGVALGGDDKGNYKLVGPLPTVTVNITKATAPTLKNITVSQKYSVTTGEKAIGTVMPADAGTLTYAPGIASKTGSVTVTSWDVNATGKVTYTLSGGAAGDTVTLPVTIKSTNYADATVNVVISLTAKDIPNVTAKDIVVTYDGNPIPADKITGTADVDGTWKWKADMAVTDVSDSGPKTVVFKPADSVNYAEVEKTITVTINRATPTGEPKYTEIKTGGKTLADAALMLAGGTIPFDEGELEWIDEKGNKLSDETVVEANKSYTWRFTPANTNYTTLTGTIVLYPASTGIVIYTPVNDAIFLSGANQIVAPGSAATFRINKNFGEFRSVAVDGVTLDKSNYRAWSGSTYVKLTPAYMKTLSAGTHTLAVYFTGATATTTFTISAGSSNPATGASDFAGVGAAVAMAAVSLLGAAAVLRRK